MRNYRKRALSNLALATDLALTKKELFKIAKQSFQNLAINCLEYSRLAKETNFAKVLHCKNPDVAMNLHKEGKGIIFFCGHQSNWEVLFLDGTSRMRGIAIGKSIKNKRLYRWIVSIREKNGGKIISPQNAMREGFRALKKGTFVGIVGDQGMPDSGYSFPFFGRRAWTSTAPALLAYKTGSPILFAETHRVSGGYQIVYSEPIWPNLDIPLDTAVTSMMNQLLNLMQKSIWQHPGEWLWQHNRWKQQTLKTLHKRFRQDCICIILPQDEPSLQKILPHLQSLKKIYCVDFLSLLAPESCRNKTLIEVDETIYYTEMKEVLLPDYRFKLVFNFSNNRQVHRHYEKFSAFEVLDLTALQKLAGWPDPDNYSEIFKRALCQKEAWGMD
jgi:KDO2-lipid IV(A) lauroyltransferase